MPRKKLGLCRGCKKVRQVEYANEKYVCVGIITPTEKPLKDVIRFCESDADYYSEMHICEALDCSALLTEAVSVYLDNVDLEKLATSGE